MIFQLNCETIIKKFSLILIFNISNYKFSMLFFFSYWFRWLFDASRDMYASQSRAAIKFMNFLLVKWNERKSIPKKNSSDAAISMQIVCLTSRSFEFLNGIIKISVARLNCVNILKLSLASRHSTITGSCTNWNFVICWISTELSCDSPTMKNLGEL